MKIFRTAVLAAALLAGSCLQAQKPAVEEYNVGACGGSSFTVVHFVIDDNKLTFAYHLADASTVVKDKEPMVFEYTSEPRDASGNTKFSGTMDYEKHKLKIAGLIHNDRMVAILAVDGDLGHVFYGEKGKVDGMTALAEQDMEFCVDTIHTVGTEQIPAALAAWLFAADVKPGTN